MSHEGFPGLRDVEPRYRARAEALLDVLRGQPLPQEFSAKGLMVAVGPNGVECLMNDDGQIARLNHTDLLEEWFLCNTCGKEGFADDIEWDDTTYRCGECAVAECEE